MYKLMRHLRRKIAPMGIFSVSSSLIFCDVPHRSSTAFNTGLSCWLSIPVQPARPRWYEVVLMNLCVSSDGAHPPIWCGSFHEARGAGGPVTQRLWGELLLPVLHDIVIRSSSTASISPRFPTSHLILTKKCCCLLIQQIYKVWNYVFFLRYMFNFFFSVKNEIVQHYKHAE